MADDEANQPEAEPPGRPTTLYRRYRPAAFSELVGQAHVSDALRNAVLGGRVGHAYLFSGPRGTGKTTTARLLAKILNCLSLSDAGEPCGVCENCTAIAAGEFYDLVELDAASNRGVDAVRDLIQSVSLGLGASSKRKVYVVDEVHMLTAEASNTLLKTLEEPPAHVVFVLATTEPGKVLPTIRSRTQHFEFGLLDHAELVEIVESVLEREEVESQRDAVDLIARRAAGSARDALSLLDQALALGEGTLDIQRVQQAFGEAPLTERLAVLNPMFEGDPAGALAAVAELLGRGTDPRRLVDELLRTTRDAFVFAATSGAVEPPELAPDDRAALAALAESVPLATFTRAIDALGAAVLDIRGPAAPDARLVLEVAVVRLCRPQSGTTDPDLAARVERLEAEVAALRAGPPSGGAGPSKAEAPAGEVATSPPSAPAVPEPGRRSGPKPALGAVATRSDPEPGGRAKEARASAEEPPAPQPADEPAVEPASSSTAAAPAIAADLSLDDVVAAWPGVLGALSMPVRSQVDLAQPVGVEGDVIVFGAPAVHMRRINAKFRENADAIKAALASSLGGEPKLKLVTDDSFSDSSTETSTSPAAPASATQSAPPDEPPPDEPPPDEVVDITELVDAPESAGPIDSASRLVEAFDATVVDENHRS